MGVYPTRLASTELQPAAEEDLSEAAGAISVEPLFHRGSSSFTVAGSASVGVGDAVFWNRAKSSPALQFALQFF